MSLAQEAFLQSRAVRVCWRAHPDESPMPQEDTDPNDNAKHCIERAVDGGVLAAS